MSDTGWKDIGHTEDRPALSVSVTLTAEAMIPVPVSWWRRIWLKLRRKPLPTRAPEGTIPMMLESADGLRRIYIPAARIQNTQEQQ